MPNIKDLEKWGYRVYNNLIYYQSNYFLMALALFILIGFIHPLKMALGLIALGIGCVLFSLACSAGPQVSQFKKDHPLVSVAALLSGVYFIVYLLNSIMVFLFGILLPVSGMFFWPHLFYITLFFLIHLLIGINVILSVFTWTLF